jgi:predicted amidophosphoribosyltransferase
MSKASFTASATNDLISNLQNPVTSGDKRLYWKQTAINHSAVAIGKLIPTDWKENGTFVPVPPSKIKTDPEHDARILRVLKITTGLTDVRELVLQTVNTNAKDKGITPEERAENYEINEDEAEPEPTHIIIFDDVVAGASHFKAMKIVLAERFPEADISGLFLARSIRQDVDLVVKVEIEEVDE